MKIGIIGAGYVGLTTGICLASLGHKVNIYDIDNQKLTKIMDKKLPFFEKGLGEMLEVVVSSGDLIPKDDLDSLVEHTDGCFICVGTPTKNNSIDLTQITNSVESLTNSIKNNSKRDYKIIIRSTIVPNTSKNIVLPILEKSLSNLGFGLAVVPEFLREGNALDDFMNPDKIVIGSLDDETKIFVKEIFSHFNNKCEFIETNLESSELIKYTNNAFFSMLISFSNEIANLSETISGADPNKILRALVSDKRITTKVDNRKIIPGLDSYLIPGCGFGGSCFPKDVQALLDYANSSNINTPLLKAVLDINAERPSKMVMLAESIIGSLKNKKISILGLTFKPDTDDLRSSPALDAIRLLTKKDVKISVYDPVIKSKDSVKELSEQCQICFSLEDALENADIALVFTKWEEFSSLNSDFLKKFMKNPVIIDGRGFLDSKKFDEGCLHRIGYF